MRSLVLIIFLLVAAPCVAEEQSAYPAGFSFVLRRTACFGSCPVYSVAVDSRGNIDFQPDENTQERNATKLSLSPAKVWQLVDALDEAWFFDRQSAYQPGMRNCSRKHYRTDHPGFRISASVDGKRNDVAVNEGCAEVDHTLMDLPKLLEHIMGIEELVYERKT
jgi:hypothetical protein